MRAASNDVFIVRGMRTPIGTEGGIFAEVPPHVLAAAAIGGALAATPPTVVDQVILGNVTNPGNLARLASLGSGIPVETPAYTINAQCTSGLTAIRAGIEAIRGGSAGCVVAGGAESVSRSAVWIGPGRSNEAGERPRVIHAPDPFSDPDMGPATDALAARLGISREDQDAYAIESYRRTLQSVEAGFFTPLLAPVNTGSGFVRADARPRRVPDAARAGRYPPAFGEGGTVTAINAAAVGDGAAVVLLASGRMVKKAGLTPVARVVSATSAAGDPAEPPVAVSAAIEAALDAAGLAPHSIGRWEINEAFAAKIVACVRHFGLDPTRVNVSGGAIAYGHPFGASGAILPVHLTAELQASGVRFGLAALAGAGGVGEAMVIESCRQQAGES